VRDAEYRTGVARLADVLDKVDGNGKSTRERIIEFCAEPRTKREIAEMLGMQEQWWVIENYIDPLIANGELRPTKFGTAKMVKQKYTSGNVPTTGIAALLEFCKEPKTRKEIYDRFGMSSNDWFRLVKPLIVNGQLKMLYRELTGRHESQKYITAE
jgi:hypothetical protein